MQNKYKAGVSLIEIILAVSLFSMIAVLVFDGQWKIGDMLLQNARVVTAVNAANNFLAKNATGDRVSGNGAEGVFSQGPFQTIQTSRNHSFSRCGTRNVLESFWQTGWGTPATTSFSFFIPNLLRVQHLGKDCGGLTSIFSDPELVLENEVELGVAGSAVSGVDVFKNKAFVGIRLPSGTSETEPDFALVALDQSFGTEFLRVGRGVNEVDAIDGFVFTANNASTSQLGVVQFSDGQNGESVGELVATSTLPNVAGVRPEAVSIFYSDFKIYIGTKRTAGHEFHIYDVSDPAFPRWLGSREMNHNINDIVVVDGYAFLATSGNIRDLIELDVRDPTRITDAAMIDLPGNEDGRSVQISGDYIFLGRYKSTQPGRNELCVLKYWFDTQGALVTELVASVAAGGDVTGITLAAGLVFVTTNNPQKEFQVFDFGLDRVLRPVGNRNLSVSASTLDIEDNAVLIGAGNQLLHYEQQ